jgi:O-methyltransferase involved in polyketide biosynthesis
MVDADWNALRLPAASARAALIRARAIDRLTDSFLSQGQRTVVVSIGSGLDTRVARLSARASVWFDLDLPEVAALRRALIPDTDLATTLAGSFLEPGWLQDVRPSVEGARVLLIAEGVLNYLPAPALASAMREVGATLGTCTLIADVMSSFFAGVAGFLGALRRSGASVAWGAGDSGSIERLLGVRVRGLHGYLRADDRALGTTRQMYRLPILRDMSRLLVAELGGSPFPRGR